MTTTVRDLPRRLGGYPATAVYPPQHDSLLLIETMKRTARVAGRRVVDLCAGSGVIAIAAAKLGAAGVTAFDICPAAVRCSESNADDAGVDIDVREDSWTGAVGCGPFEVIVSNPPYVPTPPAATDRESIPPAAGPARAWNAGADGRLVLDPLCESASHLLSGGGVMLVVQSVVADVQRSLDLLRSTGLDADVIASRRVPFGPVLSARARWLERRGRIQRGCREEELLVIRADKT